LLKYFNRMTIKEKLQTVFGALAAVGFVYALLFAGAALCAITGHGPEVCGL